MNFLTFLPLFEMAYCTLAIPYSAQTPHFHFLLFNIATVPVVYDIRGYYLPGNTYHSLHHGILGLLHALLPCSSHSQIQKHSQ